MVTYPKLYTECLRKQKYRSEKLAEAVAKKAKKDRNVDLECYFCNHCGNYHLTRRCTKSGYKVF